MGGRQRTRLVSLSSGSCSGDQHVIVSDAIFEVIYKGIASDPKKPRKRNH